jgi:hypothetical protein
MPTASEKARSLKVATAAQEETTNPVVTFEYDGEEYSYDRSKLNSAKVLQAVDDQHLTLIARHLLSVKAWDKFLEGGPEGDRQNEEVIDFVQAAFEAAGTDQGE